MTELQINSRPCSVFGRLSQFGIWSLKMLDATCHSLVHTSVLISKHCSLLTVTLAPQKGNKYKHMNGSRCDMHVWEAPSTVRPFLISWAVFSLASRSTSPSMAIELSLHDTPQFRVWWNTCRHVDLLYIEHPIVVIWKKNLYYREDYKFNWCTCYLWISNAVMLCIIQRHTCLWNSYHTNVVNAFSKWVQTIPNSRKYKIK